MKQGRTICVKQLIIRQEKTELQKRNLTHCILMDSSTVICLTSPFVILGVSGLFVTFILVLMENPVSKQGRS